MIRIPRLRAAAVVLLTALLAAAPFARAEGEAAGGAPAAPRVRAGDGVVAFVGGDVHTISSGTFLRGTILVKDGKIRRVGVDIEVPEGARIIDCTGRRILPGYVAPMGEGMALVDGQPRPGARFADSLDPFTRNNELALAAGITAFHATVPPPRGIVSWQTAVLRPAKGDSSLMLLKEPASVWINWSNAASADRMAVEEMLRRGRQYLRDADDARRAGRPAPRAPVAEEILAALRGELPVRIPANRQDDIRSALALGQDHGLKVVLEYALEAWTVPDLLARSGAVSIVIPRWRVSPDPRSEVPTGGNIGVAGILEKAGAPFCILPVGGLSQPGHGVRIGGLAARDLKDYFAEGAFAVRGGASQKAVLRAMTLGAAEALGVADRIGSIEPGKDADLQILDGDPLHYLTKVEQVYIAGRLVYEREASFYRSPEDAGTAPASSGDR